MHTYFQAAASAGNGAAVRKLENSQLLRQEIAARRDSLRALPEIVTFHNTDICNLRCVMCPRHLGQGKHALGDDLLRLVADELLPTALKANLTTGGGEPLGVGFETRSAGCAIVTTGDVGLERATYTWGTARSRWQLWLAPWSGFTGIADAGGMVHLGTDLAAGNGLVRAFVPGSARPQLPEYRRLPPRFDLQVRQIEALHDGRLLALLSMDEDLVAARDDKRAVLLVSSDEGRSWSVLHRFAADWCNAPEAFVVVGEQPLTLATDGVLRPELLVVDFDRER